MDLNSLSMAQDMFSKRKHVFVSDFMMRGGRCLGVGAWCLGVWGVGAFCLAVGLWDLGLGASSGIAPLAGSARQSLRPPRTKNNLIILILFKLQKKFVTPDSLFSNFNKIKIIKLKYGDPLAPTAREWERRRPKSRFHAIAGGFGGAQPPRNALQCSRAESKPHAHAHHV